MLCRFYVELALDSREFRLFFSVSYARRLLGNHEGQHDGKSIGAKVTPKSITSRISRFKGVPVKLTRGRCGFRWVVEAKWPFPVLDARHYLTSLARSNPQNSPWPQLHAQYSEIKPQNYPINYLRLSVFLLN
jgi:hypothetical protein